MTARIEQLGRTAANEDVAQGRRTPGPQPQAMHKSILVVLAGSYSAALLHVRYPALEVIDVLGGALRLFLLGGLAAMVLLSRSRWSPARIALLVTSLGLALADSDVADRMEDAFASASIEVLRSRAPHTAESPRPDPRPSTYPREMRYSGGECAAICLERSRRIVDVWNVCVAAEGCVIECANSETITTASGVGYLCENFLLVRLAFRPYATLLGGAFAAPPLCQRRRDNAPGFIY